MQALVSLFFIVALFLFMGYFGFVFPVWMLVRCAREEQRGRLSKTIWIVVMVALWGLGSLFYALFASGRRSLGWIAFSGLFLIIVYVNASLLNMQYQHRAWIRQIPVIIERMESLETTGLKPGEESTLKVSLSRLREELQSGDIFAAKSRKAHALLQLYLMMTLDQTLTEAEYQEWFNEFNTRSVLSPDALRTYVQSYRAGLRKGE